MLSNKTELSDLLPDAEMRQGSHKIMPGNNRGYLSLNSYMLLVDFGFLASGGMAYAAGPPYSQICAIPLIGTGVVLTMFTGLLAILGRTVKK